MGERSGKRGVAKRPRSRLDVEEPGFPELPEGCEPIPYTLTEAVRALVEATTWKPFAGMNRRIS